MEHKIGDKLVTTKDIEVGSPLTNKKTLIPKGSTMIVRADNFVIYEKSGKIQPLADDEIVADYNIDGMASFIADRLCRKLPMEELEEYVTREEIENSIAFSLDDLGF